MSGLFIYLLIGFLIGIGISNNTSDEDIYTEIKIMNYKGNPNNIRLQIIIFTALFWPYVLIKML